MLASSVPTDSTTRPQHPVLRVEQQHAELLDRAAAVLRQQELGDVARGANLRPLARRARQRAAPELDRGEHLRRARAADARHAPNSSCRARTSPCNPPTGPAPRSPGRARSMRPGRARARWPAARCRRAPAPSRCSFSRGRSCGCDCLHRTPSLLYFRGDASSVRPAAARSCCAVVLSTACSEPPQKEIDRAQAAIDAARAAGAEHYAPESFTAATDRAPQAHEAVAQRDYRLALTRALDASDRAQEAREAAAEGKAARAPRRKRQSAPPAPRCCSSTRDSRRPRPPACRSASSRPRARPQGRGRGSAKSRHGVERGELRRSGRRRSTGSTSGFARKSRASSRRPSRARSNSRRAGAEPCCNGGRISAAAMRQEFQHGRSDPRGTGYKPDTRRRVTANGYKDDPAPNPSTNTTITHEADDVEHDAVAHHRGDRHVARAVDDGVRRRGDRHHEPHRRAERGAERRLRAD